MNRVIPIDEIEQILEKHRGDKQKIIATNGCFDILHVGHCDYLIQSKKLGDILVVGLNSDTSVKQLKGKDRPLNNETNRAKLLSELRSVDYVVIFDDLNAINFLETVKPDIYTKGADYTTDNCAVTNQEKWPEYQLAKKMGIEVVLIDFVKGHSSTKIIEQISTTGKEQHL